MKGIIQMSELKQNEIQWKSIYVLGGIFAILSLIAVVLDILIGSSTGGNLSELPQTAVERFTQFQQNAWLGLYNLDLLNTINQLISIPVYFALYAALCKSNKPFALLALIIFLLGTTIFVSNNTALPMLELSRKYSQADESQKTLLAAAGEAMLARSEHGSLGAFFSFLLPTISALIISSVMLKGKVFSNGLMLIYILLVTFMPTIKNMAMAFAMPGGLLLLTWMVMITLRLFRLGTSLDDD